MSLQSIYARIQKRARRIAEDLPTPDFYRDHAEANRLSRDLLNANPDMSALSAIVAEHLQDNAGHGFKHSRKVALDAGALVIIQSRQARLPEDEIRRRTGLSHMAGLLHDVKRSQKDHAVAGAAFSRRVLTSFSLTVQEVQDVADAIRNHEAFKPRMPIDSPRGSLLADCLYDADKFRWGPDNFTDTVWDMIALYNPPLSEFIERFPQGMAGIEKIKTTFRTETGRFYGPQFIELGITIGRKLYQTLITEFKTELAKEHTHGQPPG